MLKSARKAGVRESQSIRLVRGSADLKAVRSGSDRTSLRPAEDIRSAQLWLSNGAPIADVLTMLEARHRFELTPADCRAHAVEILWAARDLSRRDDDSIPNPKESPYAAA